MSGRLHLGHRFMSLEEKGDEVIMHFQNGTIATCDLLIGMDGIKSSVVKVPEFESPPQRTVRRTVRAQSITICDTTS